jgi:hypothetical protein
LQLIDAPLTEDWLKDLDSNKEHNPRSINFSQYIPALKKCGLEQISDIVDSSIEELMKHGEMRFGDAKRLRELAKVDCDEMLKAKRTRK